MAAHVVAPQVTIVRHDRTLELCYHARLEPVEPAQVLVTVSIGPGNEAIAMWPSEAGRHALQARSVQPGWASFPDPAPPAGIVVHVASYTPQVPNVVSVADLRLPHCHVQPLPGERVLIVGARCRWRPGGADRNAIVVDADGTTVRRGTLGDGIEHVFHHR